MCTVTYVPIAENTFLLTSNRDESSARPTLEPDVYPQGEHMLLFPKDQQAGGTWIAAGSDNRAICLLNGAFVRHERKLPYRKSRGQVTLEFFDYSSAEEFFARYDFDNIEPFTLVIYERGRLFEFRWDGKKQHHREMDASQPHIWSSATLYPVEVRSKRQQWFADWLRGRKEFSWEAVMDFHKNGGEKDKENGFVMNRWGKVQTVSISCIIHRPQHTDMVYEDLLNNTITRKEIALEYQP